MKQRRAVTRGEDDDAAARAPRPRTRWQAGRGDRVVDDLALERRHRRQPDRLAAGLDLLGRLRPRSVELARGAWPGSRRRRASAGCAHRSAAAPPAGSAPAARPAPRRRGRPGRSRSPPTIETDGAVALDVHVDVAVEVGDVEQPLEVVGRDVALRSRRLARPTRARPGLVGATSGTSAASAASVGSASVGHVGGAVAAIRTVDLVGHGVASGASIVRGARQSLWSSGGRRGLLAGAGRRRRRVAGGAGPGCWCGGPPCAGCWDWPLGLRRRTTGGATGRCSGTGQAGVGRGVQRLVALRAALQRRPQAGEPGVGLRRMT